jgi:cellulose synthase/poly-beta-1,6-N-acetylglucosamine synthase-like glycosyltransferase
MEEIRTPAPASPSDSDVVASYADWLAAESQRNNVVSRREETNEYINEALRPIIIGNARAKPFAPFRHKLSALQTLTFGQATALVVIGLTCALGLLLSSKQMLTVLIAIITVFYLGDLLLSFLLCLSTLGYTVEEKIDDALVHALADADWPRYTILCPLYHEANVVPQFVRAMKALDYPANKLQILLLTEQDDTETRRAIEQLQLPRHFKVVVVPPGEPRTKPRACNFGLLHATGDYVVIFDAEDIPEPLQLKKAVLTFANHGPELACVQAKLNFYNSQQNLLTRWFTAEYSSWFDLILPGLQRAGLALPLGGTSNHFRTELLGKVGAWDAFNVTEDCDLGLRLAQHHLKTAVVDSTTYEEANSELKNWLRQRSRWVKGYIQTYLVHMRLPGRYLRSLRSRQHLREFLSLQLVVGGKTAVLFINPLMWLLLGIYALFNVTVTPAYHVLFPMPILYMGTLCLLFGNFFFMYIHLLGCMKRNQYWLIKWTLLMPIYWGMASVAAFIALYQIIFAPHYWEKTRHGLHLKASLTSASGSVSTAVAQPVAAAAMAMPLPGPLNTPHPELSFFEEDTLPHTAFLEEDEDIEEQETLKQPALQRAKQLVSNSITGAMKAVNMALARQERELAGASVSSTLASEAFKSVETFPLPAFHLRYPALSAALDIDALAVDTDSDITEKSVSPPPVRIKKKPRPSLRRVIVRVWQQRPRDFWLLATFVIACIASIVSFEYFFQNGQLLLYGDSYSHLLIARRIIDSTQPGLAQVGGVWLPLPHLLMLPFIWNNYLWQSGLAGSFVSMPCYVVSAIYLFLAARRLTHNSCASFVGVMLFVLNPNILYLQATPMSELVLIVTLAMAFYYFLAWAQDDRPFQLVLAAVAIFLATLARYDAWLLFIILLALVPVIGRIKRHSWSQIQANLIIFALPGGLGIALWMLWCAMIFGDPLYWQHGPFSAQAQQAVFIHAHALYTYHNFGQSLHDYLVASLDTIGPALLIAMALAILVLLQWRRFAPEALVSLAFLAPFAFYVVSLYSGQAALFLPGANPPGAIYGLFNARYGTQMVAPAAIFLAILAGRFSTTGRLTPGLLARIWGVVKRYTVPLLLTGIIVVQSATLAQGGIISLQDGQYGADCVPIHPTIVYLVEHYKGGRILQDTYSTMTELAAEVGIDFKNVVYEGSGPLWNQALRNPASVVDWIIMNPNNGGDLVAQHINVKSLAFTSQFTLVASEPDGLSLYHRIGLPPLPTRPVPASLLSSHQLCTTKGNGSGSHSSARPPARGGPTIHVRRAARRAAPVYSRGTLLTVPPLQLTHMGLAPRRVGLPAIPQPTWQRHHHHRGKVWQGRAHRHACATHR